MATTTHERLIAINACYRSREGDHALAALNDASRAVRDRAIGAVSLSCRDEQLCDWLPRAPSQSRYKLLIQLKKRKRQVPIDTYLRQLATSEVNTLGTVLAIGSAEVVEQYLPLVSDSASATDWSRLAKRHPDLVTTVLCQWAEKISYPDDRLEWIVSKVLTTLSEREPGRALSLVRALSRTVSPSTLTFWRVLRRHPREGAAFILEQENGLPKDAPHLPQYYYGTRTSSRALRAFLLPLAQSELIRLLERYPDFIGAEVTRASWFGKLAPEKRIGLWKRFRLAWRQENGAVAVELVQLLPQPFRTEEARRHSTIPALQTLPASLLPYASCLPWEEALQAVNEALKAQDGGDRTLAWHALTGVVRYERNRLNGLLTIMRARRFEQDPVRLAMIQGLAKLPSAAFHHDHLADVAQILKSGLDAADLSYGTALQMGELLLKLLPTYTDWSVLWLNNLARSRGQFYSYQQRIIQLPDTVAQHLIMELLPVFNAWEARERERPLLNFARGIGRKLELVSEFRGILERMVSSSSYNLHGVEALEILLKHDRSRAARLIPQLIAADGSWMTCHPVYTYIHRYRQDYLTPFLGQTSYQGRFSTGNTRFVLPVTNGFVRWTPEQQTIFSRVLVEVVDDKERDTPAVLRVIRQLSQLLYIEPTQLVRFARDHREPVKVAALWALGRHDAGQGVPTLLEALEDDRARYAIYALRRALLDMPPDKARQILNQISANRVTVAKEVVRLLGELPTDTAYQDLLAWDARDLHRDVRAAFIRALWMHLERDESWTILERAAHSDEYAIATIAARTPADRLSSKGQQRLLHIISSLLQHSNIRVRQRSLERLQELPVSDPDGILLAPIEQCLFSKVPDEVQTAATSLFAVYATRDIGRLVGLIERLIPSRQSLQQVLRVLASQSRRSRQSLVDTTKALLRALRRDPFTGSVQVPLIMSGLSWVDIAATVEELQVDQALNHDMIKTFESYFARRVLREECKASTAERALRSNPALVVRYLGALLLRVIGDEHGWTPERIAALKQYREDDAILVASTAQFIFWTGEGSEEAA